MTPVMKMTSWILMILLAAPVAIAAAAPQQSASADQEDPLAAAARRAREHKKDDGKVPKVWDNDNVPTSGMINVVGQMSEPAPDASAAVPNLTAAASAPANPAALSKEQQAALQSSVGSAKEQVESLKSDIDIMLRKYVLDDQSYHGKPDFASDKAGQAALDDEKAQIEAKQQELADAQKRLDDLQAQLAASPSSQDSK